MSQLYRDEFFRGANSAAGTNGNANIGDFGWNMAHSAAMGSCAKQPARDGRFGIQRLASPNSAGIQALYLGNASNGGKLLEENQVVSVEFDLTLIANRTRLGFGNNVTATGLGAEGVYLEANPTFDPEAMDWLAIARSGNVAQVKHTGVPLEFGSDKWIKAKVERWFSNPLTTLGWKLYLNDTLVATFDPTAPDTVPDFSSSLLVAAQCVWTPEGTSNVDLDTCDLVRV